MRTLIALIFFPLVALAQPEAEVPPPVAAPAAPPMHAAEPILPDWNLGAGITFPFGAVGFTSSLSGGLAALGGGLTVSSLAIPIQPRTTLLIERRLSERLFLGFQVAASYGAYQSDSNSALSYRNLTLEGAIGLRRIFNPRGIVEVSWLATSAWATATLKIARSSRRCVGTLSLWAQSPA